MRRPARLLGLASLLLGAAGAAQPRGPCEPLITSELSTPEDVAAAVREGFVKYEYRIPMRDGVKLYTEAFVPRDRTRAWPILLVRTPYGVSYGVDVQPDFKGPRAMSRFAPSLAAVKDGFILVHQDVRGRMMSEGEFVDVRPRAKKGGTDEVTDAFDTVDFLVKHLPANNGKVGVWGISYPGFYAAQAAVDAHPAIKAVSPQAPVTDWFVGDDFHHNGALFLLDSFRFFWGFGHPRPQPTRHASWDFDYQAGDSYDFFLELGPLANLNPRYFKGDIAFWNQVLAHPNRDEYWKAKDPLPSYRNVRPAVLTVGGLFDAEDLWGTLATYHAFDEKSPGADVRLVLGPWRRGGWARGEGDRLGDVSFDWKTSRYYQTHIELPFFRRYLKGCAEEDPAEAWVFETGTNVFTKHPAWPPKDARATQVYFAPEGGLTTAAPPGDGFEAWLSDPKKPVPYRSRPSLGNDGEYMLDDQRFAARRPDVMVHATPVLEEELALAGPIDVSLEVSTTGADADFVVKLIDVYPFDHPDPDPNPTQVHLGGYQQLVRAEVFRGRFRDGFEVPRAFVPSERAKVHFTLPDVSHAFRSGHRLMVQVQSSWFPLVDMNPQTFVDPYTATAEDFRPATHRLYFSKDSWLKLPITRGEWPARPTSPRPR